MSSSLTVKAYLALVDERTKNDYGKEREGGERERVRERERGMEGDGRRWRERKRERIVHVSLK